ncbi:amine oxidase [Arthrobacter sp. Hiyo6]|nr:amine oxidase [Arthrobacter sp. Hiyo6]
MSKATIPDGRRIAVIGSGVAGLTAAYVLNQKDNVTLFEADSRLGGHAHTHDVAQADGTVLGVDTGFIVHNERTYPTLLRLFAELGVETQDSEMSMSVRCDGCGLEYAGARAKGRGIIPRPSTLLRGRYLLMLLEVTRFYRRARALLAETGTADTEMTLGDFLAREKFSTYFNSHFMTPIVSAVWSCDPTTALAYRPAISSPSWATTDCSGSPAHPSGVPSPAARAATWTNSPPPYRISAFPRRSPAYAGTHAAWN